MCIHVNKYNFWKLKIINKIEKKIISGFHKFPFYLLSKIELSGHKSRHLYEFQCPEFA